MSCLISIHQKYGTRGSCLDNQEVQKIQAQIIRVICATKLQGWKFGRVFFLDQLLEAIWQNKDFFIENGYKILHVTFQFFVFVFLGIPVIYLTLQALALTCILHIKTFHVRWLFPVFSWPVCQLKWWHCKENIGSHHCQVTFEFKGLLTFSEFNHASNHFVSVSQVFG